MLASLFRLLLQMATSLFVLQDQGRGIPKDRLTQLFEPGLLVKDGRVSIANWGLFNSRSILADHGGDIEIESLSGHGDDGHRPAPPEFEHRSVRLAQRSRWCLPDAPALSAGSEEFFMPRCGATFDENSVPLGQEGDFRGVLMRDQRSMPADAAYGVALHLA